MASGTIKAVALKTESDANAQAIQSANAVISALANDIAIIVNEDIANVNVSVGQYVLVMNSTITGISDGLYKVARAVTAGTSFVAADLSSTEGNVANELAKTMTGATSNADGVSGMVPAPSSANKDKYLRGDATWAIPTNTTYAVMTGASSSADGASGLVPQPLKANRAQFLRGDKSWATPSDTWRAYQLVRYSFSWSCSASSYVDIAQGSSGSNKINVTAISGYEPVAVLRLVSGDANVIVSSFNFHDYSGASSIIRLRNIATSSKSATGYASVLWLKTD